MTAETERVMSGEVKTDGLPLNPLRTAAGPEPELLCIFGTGDLGRSLGQRLLQTGYRVVYGSRRPHSCGPVPQGAQVQSTASSGTLHFYFIFLVLVDVSNNLKKNLYPEANAEYLQRLIPGAFVVKAFNTLSAWALQNGPSDANRQVFLCGDSAEAKQQVSDVATRLSFSVVDRGSLSAARELEDFPLQLFPEWRLPLWIATGLTASFFFYAVIVDIVYSYQSILCFSPIIQVFPIVSLIMLSLCYLPGVLASFFQLYRGTKYRRFPDWLDRWMLCRKQLGLLALGFASLHVLYTLLIPIRYFVPLFTLCHYQIRENKTVDFETSTAWYTDSYYSMGILGFGLYVILGISSLPSVSNALSWREFNFIQVGIFMCARFSLSAHSW
uniref:STEAP family member 4 n=1 Tax=Myripristis murdjan TaxID=586833 RepID=A0A668A172_9TELE